MLNKEDMEKRAIDILKDQYTKTLKQREEVLLGLLSTNAEFKENFDNTRILAFEIPKLEYENAEDSLIAKLKDEYEVSHKAVEKVLTENNLTLRDIEIKTIPNDNMFKKHPHYKKVLSQLYLQNMNLPNSDIKSFDAINYDVFDINIRDSVKKLYISMKLYTDDLQKTTKKTVTLLGGTGVGKTYLTTLMTYNAAQNAYFTVFTTAFNLVKNFIAFHSAKVADKDAILAHFLGCDLLVIDDLGSEPFYNNISEEYLYLLINERQIAGKNTVITSNLDIDKLREIYGERIFSRIANQQSAMLLKLEGQDLRLKK